MNELIQLHEKKIIDANTTIRKERSKFLDNPECKPLRMKLYIQKSDNSVQVNCSAMHYCGCRYGPKKHLYHVV